MKSCDLITPAARLHLAMKTLQEKWALTREYWNDQAAEQFEANHLEPLAPVMEELLTAINRLATVVEQAEREVS